MTSKYPWPSSQITEEDMHLLHEAREKYSLPISELLAKAIREAYEPKPFVSEAYIVGNEVDDIKAKELGII